MSDLRSCGTRSQTQIQEHQTKKISKGQNEKRDKRDGWGNKYKSPNFKALIRINLSYFQIKADGNHYISRP